MDDNQRYSEEIRNNKLYSSKLKELLETYNTNIVSNDPNDHIGFVRAQAAIEALRLLDGMLKYPSEILENKNK